MMSDLDRVDRPAGGAHPAKVESRGGHLVAEIVTAVERTTYATALRILQAMWRR